MPYYKFQKVVANGTTYRFVHPNTEGEQLSTELATINGFTYVHVKEGAELPEQHPQTGVVEITPSVEEMEAIKESSHLVRNINNTVQDKIAERYSMADEIKLLRTHPSVEFDAYNAYVEECRQWGREQKANIGVV
jgi:hypothetical protein